MELYLKVAFWSCVARVVLYLLILTAATYPRKTTHSLGSDVVSVVLGLLFAFWSGSLIFSH